MGNCGSTENPVPRNSCYTSIGEEAPRMDGFCTTIGPAGNGTRNNYCRAISDAGEFITGNTSGTCLYNSCRPGHQVSKAGCCKGCCGIAGGGLQCVRASFTGDVTTCCFNDLACNENVAIQNNPLCFSDTALQNTCPDGSGGTVNARSIVGRGCRDQLFQYCTGTLPNDDPNSTAWKDRWTEGPYNRTCHYALVRNLYHLGGSNQCFVPPLPNPNVCDLPAFPGAEFDSAGYFWGQQLISKVMERLEEQGSRLGALPGFPDYDPFQDYLRNAVCCPYPGVCDSGLKNRCADVSAQRLSLNPTLAQWCGCHLSPEVYQEYTRRYNITPECTPMCNRDGAVAQVGVNGQPVQCRQDICLIDNISVNLINSELGGGVQFNQICGTCPNGQCSCVVADNAVSVINSQLQNFIPVQQGCGNLLCSQANPDPDGPETIPVPCNQLGTNPFEQVQEANRLLNEEATKTSRFWTVVVILIGLVIIFLLIFFFYPRTRVTVASVQDKYGAQVDTFIDQFLAAN